MIKIGKDISKFSSYSYKPTNKKDLCDIIKERIIKEAFSFSMVDYILEEGNKLSLNALARITRASINKFKALHSELKEYYQGCIFKDEKLKQLINEEIIPYAEKPRVFV